MRMTPRSADRSPAHTPPADESSTALSQNFHNI